MFQSSPTNIQEYPCPQHRKDKVTHICTDFRCGNSPLLCVQCLSDSTSRTLHGNHEEFLLPIHEAIPELAVIIDSSKSEMSKLFMATAGRKDSEQLLKKMELGDRMHQQMDGHIKSLKQQVDREFDSLQTEFLWRWHQAKQSAVASIQNYQKIYLQNIEAYRQMIEPVVTFNSRSKYYSNSNSISLKLLAEIKRKSMEWYLQLKRIMTFATKLTERPQNLLDGYTRATNYMNMALAEELPLVRENTEGRSSRLQQFVADTARDIVSVKDLKTLGSFDQENQTNSTSSPTTMNTGHSTRVSPQPLVQQQSSGSQKDLGMGPINGGTKITLKPTIRF